MRVKYKIWNFRGAEKVLHISATYYLWRIPVWFSNAVGEYESYPTVENARAEIERLEILREKPFISYHSVKPGRF